MTGFDKTFPAVMVPKTGGTNPDTKIVKFRALKGQAVTLEAENPAMLASISPSSIPGDNQDHTITLTGGAQTGTTRVRVKNSAGQVIDEHALQVDVKPELNISVTYFVVHDPTVGVGTFVPSTQALQAHLDRIFPKQANIFFTVHPGGTLVSPYDSFGSPAAGNGDKKLQVDREFGPPAPTEPLQIRADRRALGLQDGNKQSLYVHFVPSIHDPNAKLGADTGGWARSLLFDGDIYVQKDWPRASTGFVENLTAHELGHKIGRGGQIKLLDTVSNPDPSLWTPSHADAGQKGGCADCLMLANTNRLQVRERLTRDDWNVMNFVLGSPVLFEKRRP